MFRLNFPEVHSFRNQPKLICCKRVRLSPSLLCLTFHTIPLPPRATSIAHFLGIPLLEAEKAQSTHHTIFSSFLLLFFSVRAVTRQCICRQTIVIGRDIDSLPSDSHWRNGNQEKIAEPSCASRRYVHSLPCNANLSPDSLTILRKKVEDEAEEEDWRCRFVDGWMAKGRCNGSGVQVTSR